MSGIMLALLGAASYLYTAITGNVTGVSGAGVNAGGQLAVNRDGTWQITRTGTSGTPSPSGVQNWATPATGNPGDFHWVRATILSGTVTTGTTGSWLALTSDRTWTKTSTGGTDQVDLTIAIATDAAGANIVSSGTVSLGYDHV
jgi:hypothetical protein